MIVIIVFHIVILQLESTSSKTLVLASPIFASPARKPDLKVGARPHSKLFKKILNTNFHLKALPHNNEEVDRERKSDSASKLKKKIKFAFKNKNRKMRVRV